MKFGVIFALDEVLIDTQNWSWRIHKDFLRRYKIDLSREDSDKYYGRSFKEDVRNLNENYGLSLNVSKYAEILSTIEWRMMKQRGANKNLLHLLDNLKENNIKMGVESSFSKERSKRLLRLSGLRKYFSTYVSEEEVFHEMPSPIIFYETARRLRIPKDRCIVVEGSYNGILGAKIAKMKPIGYLGQNNSREDLRYSDKIIKDFSEINHGKLSKMVE